MLHVTDAKYVGDYRVWFAFNDGTAGEADLKKALKGPAFSHLLELKEFRRFEFDREAYTIVWPNGADFAPEYLKDLVIQQAAATMKAS